jgi:hypothetical protein
VSNEPVAVPFGPSAEYSCSGPLAEMAAPSFPEAGIVRDQFPATKPLDPGAVRNYLIARTVTAFGRCLGEERPAVPVYLSCMYAVFLM